MQKFTWLQFFADDAGGEAATGVAPAEAGAPADAGQGTDVNVEDVARQEMASLGIPAKYAGIYQKSRQRQQPTAAPTQQPTAEELTAKPAAAAAEPAAKRPFAEIMEDPDYKPEFQKIMAARGKETSQEKTRLKSIEPMLNYLSRAYGAKDEKELIQKVMADKDLYSSRALELGATPEVAMKMDMLEQQIQTRSAEDTQAQNESHIQKLVSAGEEFGKTHPGFDLRAELQNPEFKWLTGPEMNWPVERAYASVHFEEIEQQKAEAVKNAVTQAQAEISRKYQARAGRPSETGNGNAAGSSTVTPKLYSQMTPAERAQEYARIKAGLARGEKVFPR